jgi:hypothetical protein
MIRTHAHFCPDLQSVQVKNRVDLAVKLMEAQQSEAKWRRRAKLLQETNARLEAMLQKRPGNANVSGRLFGAGVNKAHARWCK